MRCGKCEHVWTAYPAEEPKSSFQQAMEQAREAEAEQLVTEPAKEPAANKLQELLANIKARIANVSLPTAAKAAIGGLLLWAVIATGVYVYWGREWYQTLAPQTVAQQSERLVFDRVIMRMDEVDGANQLTIEGQIINLSRASVQLPDVNVSLQLRDGTVVELGLIAMQSEVLANESVKAFEQNFVLTNADTLDQAEQLSLTFSSAPQNAE